MNNWTDQTLLEGFKADDRAAVKQIFFLYYQPLCFFTNKLIGDRNAAEEIVFFAIKVMYRDRECVRSMGQLKKALYTHCRHQAFLHTMKDEAFHLSTWQVRYEAFKIKADEMYFRTELVSAYRANPFPLKKKTELLQLSDLSIFPKAPIRTGPKPI